MSGMFNMGATQGKMKSSESGNWLKAGIHEVVFNGIEKASFDKGGVPTVVMDVHFSNESGAHKQRIFAPDNAERRVMNDRELASAAENFIIMCRHIIDGLVPEVGKGIDEGTVSFNAPNFDKFVEMMIQHTTPAIGKTVQIKLLPNGQYVSFPRYVASISKKTGDLFLSTRFVGENLTLNDWEVGQINGANAARPTPAATFSKSAESTLEGMGEDFSSPEDDDLPF